MCTGEYTNLLCRLVRRSLICQVFPIGIERNPLIYTVHLLYSPVCGIVTDRLVS